MICALCERQTAVLQVPGYRIEVCQGCWDDASGGWPKRYDIALFAAMAKRGLLIPDRTADGYLPRIYAPPADFSL